MFQPKKPDETKTNDSTNVPVLLKQLLNEQDCAWNRSADSWAIESVLESLAVLPIDHRNQILLELIFHEIVIRESLGHPFSIDEYKRRFPALNKEIQMQWEVLELVGQGRISASGTTIDDVNRREIVDFDVSRRFGRYEIIRLPQVAG